MWKSKLTLLALVGLVLVQARPYAGSGGTKGGGYGYGEQLQQTLEGPSGGSSYGGGGGGGSYGGGQQKAPSSYGGGASSGSSKYGGGGGGYGDSQEPAPEPYDFQYETMDEYGVKLVRMESQDANGNVKGSYMYRDPQSGLYRTVEYGDSGSGFTAYVKTNEPGVVSHKPADAEYIKNE